jgi:hypothetical protein
MERLTGVPSRALHRMRASFSSRSLTAGSNLRAHDPEVVGQILPPLVGKPRKRRAFLLCGRIGLESFCPSFWPIDGPKQVGEGSRRARRFGPGVRLPLAVGMASTAESIIQRIFESAEKDERSRPISAALRDAFARGAWKPDAVAAIVDQATLKEVKKRE